MKISYYDLFQTRLNISGQTQQERIINNQKRIIINNFNNSPSLFSVFINDVSKNVLIVDNNSLNKPIDSKKIIMYPDDIINTGDLVLWDNEYWLCVKDDEYKGIYYKGIIQKCNEKIKWKDENSIIYEYPCIATKSNFDIEEGKYISLLEGSLFIYTQMNNDIKTITPNQRFIFGSQVYEVVGIDDVTNYGLMQFSVKLTTKVETDDFIEKIADNSTLYDSGDNGSGDLW